MGSKVALGDLCTFLRGASVPRARMFDSGEHLYVHYGDLYRGFDVRIDVESPQAPLPYISCDEKIRSSQMLKDQDIVYVLTSETVDDLGHAYLFTNPKGRSAVAGTETTIARVVDTERLLPSYLNWLLQSEHFKRLLRQYVRGMKVFRVHPDDLSKIEIDLPSVADQCRIVAILDAVFDRQLVLGRINGYLYECCLAKMRKLTSATNGETTVEAYCESIYSGGTPSTKDEDCWNGCHPWLSSGETRSRFVIDTERTITEYGVNNSSTKMARKGSVVMASAGQGLTRGQTSMLLIDTYVNQSIIVMEPKDKCGAYLLLALGDSYDRIRAWSDSTSSRGSMSGKLLKRFSLPKLSQNAINELHFFTKPVFQSIESNLVESRALLSLRDNLLPKLMSGEIDVSEIDAARLNSHLYGC